MRTINQPALYVFRIFAATLTVTSVLLFSLLLPAQAGTPTAIPDGSGYQWTPVYTGFLQPVDFGSPPSESEKTVVVEQGGTVQLLVNGNSAGIFLDIRDRVGADGSEQGLLGLAFHPDYSSNRQFFMNYTDRTGNTIITRFTASSDGTRADPASESRLLLVDQPYDNHNGGGLAFGPDGYLYVALGDGGSAGDPQNIAQNLNSLLGKILRLDVNKAEGYAIPSDNPFASGGGLPEIWAYGLRNPWKITFDPVAGDLWIADVGQRLWEEIDYLPAGSAGGMNFGWNIREGSHLYNTNSPDPGNLVNPVHEYDHSIGCSITGGAVYHGTRMPEWQGVYFFGDFCQGSIFGLSRSDSGTTVKQISQINATISSFGVDGAGELYALDHGSGIIYRFEPR